jgi:uncharacterized protein (TIGR00288 family)
MAEARIAVLFDAENINCGTATKAMKLLADRGSVQIKRAVGDFSSATLAAWIACGRDNGIELVLQPSLGKGKNGADIRLTIEAMDIVHQGHVDTIALVTRDRDFTPLALRLREAGLQVLGLAQAAPSDAFVAACSRFEVIATPVSLAGPDAEVAVPKKAKAKVPQPLGSKQLARLRKVVAEACQNGPILASALRSAICRAEPDLLPLLGGKGKFQKRLLAQGLVEIAGKGNEQRLVSRSGRRAA